MAPPIRKLIGLGLTALILIGTACAREVGRPFDTSAADALTPGRSTLQEAMVLLGPPTASFRSASGREVAQWSYFKGKAGGTESANLMILFGPDGRMIAITQRGERRVDEVSHKQDD